jgi:hypothetical protein
MGIDSLEQEISDATGFDYGDRFGSPEQVRAYFTVEEQRHMLGAAAVEDQLLLDRWAERVITNRWHCAFVAEPDQMSEARLPADGEYFMDTAELAGVLWGAEHAGSQSAGAEALRLIQRNLYGYAGKPRPRPLVVEMVAAICAEVMRCSEPMNPFVVAREARKRR